MAQPLTFRALEAADYPRVSALAAVIFRAHYPGIISTEQVEYMLRQFYAEASLREQVEVRHHQFWLAEQDGQLIGFVSIENQGGGQYYVHKLYVDMANHRSGVGSALLSYVLMQYPDVRIARLKVNRFNIHAINFYFKQGFVIERVQDFDIGEGFVLNDYVMKKIIGRELSTNVE